MKRVVKSIVLLALGVIVVVGCVVAVRTARFGARTSDVAVVQQAARPLEVPDPAAVTRLSEAVKFRTISYFDSAAKIPEFRRLHAYLEKSYPLVHARLTREILDSATLLYTWRGSDTSLAPVLLMGHQDVVPVEPGTEKDWKHGPFSGDIAEGFVWGRGTLDDKISVLGTLEGAEALLKAGFGPRRSLIFAFGYTEEVGGPSAVRTAETLKARGIKPLFVMDEGGALGDSIVPGVPQRVALIGVTEKGYLSLRLTATAQGGHSSMPGRETAVSILASAVARVQETPLPSRLDDVTLSMFDHVGPLMPYSRKMVMANVWLFGPVLKWGLERVPSGNAVVRTTTAATMISGGIKDNVIPPTATAVINFRLLPGDSVAWVVARVKEIVADSRVEVTQVPGTGREASEVSPTDSEGYRLLAQTIREVYPGTHVSPYLLVGGTDSRNFYLVTPNVYRFAPIMVKGETLKLAHGTNERVSVEDYLTGVSFYRRLIENASR